MLPTHSRRSLAASQLLARVTVLLVSCPSRQQLKIAPVAVLACEIRSFPCDLGSTCFVSFQPWPLLSCSDASANSLPCRQIWSAHAFCCRDLSVSGGAGLSSVSQCINCGSPAIYCPAVRLSLSILLSEQSFMSGYISAISVTWRTVSSSKRELGLVSHRFLLLLRPQAGLSMCLLFLTLIAALSTRNLLPLGGTQRVRQLPSRESVIGWRLHRMRTSAPIGYR